MTRAKAKLSTILAGLSSRLDGTILQCHIRGAVVTTLFPGRPILLAPVLITYIGERDLEKIPNNHFPSRDDKALALRIIDAVLTDDRILADFYSFYPAIRETEIWIKEGLSRRQAQVFKGLELGIWDEFIESRIRAWKNLQALLNKNPDAGQRERAVNFARKRIIGKNLDTLLFEDFDLLENLEKAKFLPGRPKKCSWSEADYNLLHEIRIRVLRDKQTVRQACLAVTNGRKTNGMSESEIKRLERAYKAKMALRLYQSGI